MALFITELSVRVMSNILYTRISLLINHTLNNHF